MRLAIGSILVLSLLAASGCAGRPGASGALTPATTRPLPAQADLPLDQIEPKPTLASTRPTTAPTSRPSIDALLLYAQARGQAKDGQRFTAIAMLQKALALDPDSFELWYALGEAYLWRNTSPQHAVEAFGRAADLRPDHLGVQLILGEQYLALKDAPRAIEHLRKALLTTDYRHDDNQAAAVDFLLARALQQQGYCRAAIECYQRLMGRLESPSSSLRANPELAILASRPDLLFVQMGDLNLRRNDPTEALRLFEVAAKREPGVFDYQARVVRALLTLRRSDDATRRAADTVMRFRASSDSLALMQEVYRKLGREQAAVDELRRLHEQNPADRAIFFALTDQLLARSRNLEAETLLKSAIQQHPGDFEFVRKLYSLYESRDDVASAARVLIEAAAAQPDSLHQMGNMWGELLRPSRKNRLRLSVLEKLQVAPRAEAARLFWVSRLADIWKREVLTRRSLEQAVKITPIFAPAFRATIGQYWQRADWDNAQKLDASRRLQELATAGGDPALASELRGIALSHQKDYDQAVAALTEAVKLGPASLDRQLNYIACLRVAGSDIKAERLLWKLASDQPLFEDVWGALFSLYAERGATAQAEKVLTQWLSSDPGSIRAQLVQAVTLIRGNRSDLAQRVLLKLFIDHSDNLEVLTLMQAAYQRDNKLDEFIARLEEQRKSQPDNREVSERLVMIYAAQQRVVDATRVADETRRAVASDPELLYYVAHLYEVIGQRSTVVEVLQQVLKLDSAHPGANNDLGYQWADEGVNLDRAEALIRAAVQAEPDNQSFLDSLGWVLYKRSKFDEAQKFLQQAIGDGALPDPVVLDHLGDAFYRLGDTQKALAQWRRAQQRLGDEEPNREDLKLLQRTIPEKLRQAGQGQPVKVAPVVETRTAAAY